MSRSPFPRPASWLRPLALALALAGVAAASDLASLARRFAPVWRQDTASDQDFLTAIDFDGNWVGDDNWENQPLFPARATVYWGGVETDTHVFLTYATFHPRDYSWWNNPLLSHENDLEGAQLVLEKSPDGPRLVALATVFHLQFLRVEVPGGYPAREADGELRFEGERPVLAIESRGHGVEAWDGEEFPGGDGVVYRPGDTAEVPESTDDRDVSYQLVDLADSLWARRFEVGPQALFGKAQEFGGETFGYAFAGTRYGDHKANAPWGWQAEGLPRGTFFLDPATMVAALFEVPEDFATEYAPNPYTGSAAGRRARVAGRFRALHDGFLD